MRDPSSIPIPSRRSGLNGDRGALAVDRAIGELRRGRCIGIESESACFVFAAIETIGTELLNRLTEINPAAKLLLTAERARASGLAPAAEGPVALKLDKPVGLQFLRSLGGMAEDTRHWTQLASSEPWQQDEAPVLAAFGLAKAARLVPAIVGFMTARCDDPSVHTLSLAAILEHATAAASGVQLISEARVPLAGAEASRVSIFRDEYGGGEHVAVVIGAPDLSGSVPVRLHSACLTGDLLASLRCDCGEQLSAAVKRIAELGGGILLYLDQEGRSIGLANKLRAYAIQDTGVDTFEANRHLGFTSDERSYELAVAMLQRIGVTRVRLLTNNPLKIDALREHGIDVEDRLPLVAEPNVHNAAYIQSKRERAGHLSD
jgi:GTP cyclohydrolase II